MRRMSYAEVNGQQLYFEDTGGDGAVVVLSHGFLMDHEMFAPQVAALRDQYRVVTWDERGFGLTQYDGRPFTYWDSARDCLGLLDHLGIEQGVLGGMSQGGFLSLRAALLAPERVRALILLDTQAGAEHPDKIVLYQGMADMWLAVGAQPDLADLVATIIIGDPVENPKWIAKWAAQPNDYIVEPVRCLLGREDISGRLSEIGCPALVVHGTEDTAIEMALAEALAAGLAGSTGVVQVGGSHAANLVNPGPVNAAIREFLGSLPA